MLSPEYYEGCADQILSLYEQLENDVISDIIRRMMKTGKVTESAKHQAEILQNAGLFYDDILRIIARNTDATSQHVRTLFEDAGVEAVNFDNEIYRENGETPVDIRQSPAMRQTLEAGYRKTLGNMKNLTMTTAVTSQTAYVNACNQAYMQVASGAFSYPETIKTAIKKTAENGAMVLYPSGHQERIDVAVRRAVLTGVGQTCKKIGEMNAEESECDIMEITAHSGARPDHARWQGQLVSLSGRNAGRVIEGKKVLSLRQIGYGKGDGFGGWNCRHDWFPFFEGYSKPVYSDDDLKRLDEKNIEYNGKKYSKYEISQIQRHYEREIRAAKREQTAFRIAVQEAKDPELKQVMQGSLNYANDIVKRKQAKMRDFINQTSHKRDYFREQNYADKNIGNSLTSATNSGKIELKDISTGISVNTKYFKGELKYYDITDERINKIKPVKLETLSDENNKKLTDACKDLLSYMKDEPVKKEGLIAFDMNMKEITRYRASGATASVRLPDLNENSIIIHNHPSGLIFSESDLKKFYEQENLKILGAIGNNGSTYFISKNSKYDDYEFYEYVKEIRMNYLNEMPPEEHIKFIEEVMENVKEYGVEFIRR